MVIVQVAREMLAPLDKVWDIVSDIDNEPLYWRGTKCIKNISKIGNVVEREVVIAFRESKCKETVVLNPKKNGQSKYNKWAAGRIKNHHTRFYWT